MSSTATILISLSVALLSGLLLSRLAKLVRLPAITAYLVGGVLIGPYILGASGIPGMGICRDQLAGFGIISDLALGFIAFSMGSEFRIDALKKIGKQATVIGIIQALFTTILVDIVLISLHFEAEFNPMPINKHYYKCLYNAISVRIFYRSFMCICKVSMW